MTLSSPTPSVGERIAQLRKERGLTQAKLAERARLSTSAIAMYETNRRQPDERTLAQIAEALGVEMAQIAPHLAAAAVPPPRHQQAKPAPNESHPGDRAAASEPNRVEREAGDAPGVTQLVLTKDEARLILFVRMHPDAMPFLQSYVTADPDKRRQLERAWRLIQAFQG
ncbi:helix-turn-helix domain-containing protein [Alicyclobacillus acidocaldarius]|uniref:Transcriptional regulator, XRE family n=1 Tax=Alicyclobacillus acidocaldarius (strain Tc-4-1) TaxID=1048834 RepID=F8II73_ALIAT|nr:helix-turn-helix transcriptional regulator [Alicyclobacillus acidocaldarius]AEJ44553.1 transcriptional regulator, XRE family [Alicyclobacillus acidocaldarius subsp. acidocaldarius Tc-4-1]